MSEGDKNILLYREHWGSRGHRTRSSCGDEELETMTMVAMITIVTKTHLVRTSLVMLDMSCWSILLNSFPTPD